MAITKTIRVIKVPLPKSAQYPDRPQAFPKMPRLYLELLENKAKIKQDLINKEYIPPSGPAKTDISDIPEIREKYEPREHRKSRKENDEINEKISRESRESRASRDESSNVTPEIKDDSLDSKAESPDSGASGPSNVSDRSESDSRSESRSESDKEDRESKDSDELSVRLKELLADTDDERGGSDVENFESFKKKLDREDRSRDQSRDRSESSDKYSRQHSPPVEIHSRHTTPYHGHKERREERREDYERRDDRHERTREPPTLADLERKGQYQNRQELRDVNYTTMDEQEVSDKKREILFKFELLKKSYPSAKTSIPEFTIHSDLDQMKKEYDSVVRRLSLDSTVESYKQYLIGGFMLTEFIFGNFLGFDMQGFTQQQIVTMSSYERLLIELGEKSYVPSGSKWPVELRLLFMIIMNAAFFIVGKMIMRKTGANLMNMINSMNSNHSSAPDNTTSAPLRRRRMRGPNIDLDDLPEASEDIQVGA